MEFVQDSKVDGDEQTNVFFHENLLEMAIENWCVIVLSVN